jgi:hypothetical protein
MVSIGIKETNNNIFRKILPMFVEIVNIEIGERTEI